MSKFINFITPLIYKMGGGSFTEWLLSMGKLIVIIIAMGWLEILLHESFHALVNHLLGGTANLYFSFFGLWGGKLYFVTIPSDPRAVAFTGGLGTATVFSLLYLLGEKHWDWRFKFSFFAVISVEYIYGLVEGFTF